MKGVGKSNLLNSQKRSYSIFRDFLKKFLKLILTREKFLESFKILF